MRKWICPFRKLVFAEHLLCTSPFLGIEDTVVNKTNRTLGYTVRMGAFLQNLSKIYATLDSENLNEVRNVVI